MESLHLFINGALSSLDYGTSLALLTLSLPHIFYAYVWTCSNSFREDVKAFSHRIHPVDAFSSVAWFLKLVQAFVIISYLCVKIDSWQSVYESFVPMKLVLAFSLFIIGQWLNLSVYKAIGHNGVYYGVRLGRPVPWHTGWPYSLGPFAVPHPQ